MTQMMPLLGMLRANPTIEGARYSAKTTRTPLKLTEAIMVLLRHSSDN